MITTVLKRPILRIPATFAVVLGLVSLSGCLKENGDFGDLVGGSIEEIDELTIDQVLPDVNSLVIEQSQTQSFFVSARAPTGRTVSYSWTYDGNPVSTTSSHTIIGALASIGTRDLVVTLTDGVVTKSRTWSIKVNGPPTVTAVTTGTPKTAVGSPINIVASGSDPNNDTLTYDWKLNGVSSAYLVGTGATAVLTGHSSIVGSVNITVSVSDGTAEDDYTWTAEINHFPQACNTMTTGQICTYSGTPSIGDGINPLNSDYDLKIAPIAHAQDALGNLFIADWLSNVVWYWNKTSNTVTRLGVSIPANTIKVVAGTGEAATGPDGIALSSGVYGPRGLYYNDSTQRLYISEYSSSRVRYVDSNGFIYTGIGGGASHVDGQTAFSHACANPAGLVYSSGTDSIYVACRGHHRVKRWDLSTDLAYTVLGSGGSGWGAMPAAPTSIAVSYPYSLFLTNEGLYVAHNEQHRVTFLNMSGGAKAFWTSSTTVNVPNGQVNTIIGSGASGAANDIAPTGGAIGNPTGLVVDGDTIYLTIINGNNDTLYAANNSASNILVGTTTINAGKIRKVTSASAGYNGSGILFSSSQVNEPYFMSLDVLDSTKLLFSDYNNRRLRYFGLSAGRTYDVIGSGKIRYGFYGDSIKPTLEHLFQYITGLVFDSSTRELFFTDSQNCRIRRTDAYGRIDTAVARGCGNPTVDNDVPSNSFLSTSLAYDTNDHAGLTLLTDGTMVIANNVVHNMRIWNRTASDNSYWNVFMQNDRVSNLAGDYLGSGNGPDGPALSARMLRPSHSAYDSVSGNLWILDSNNHCIRSLDSSGDLTAILGTCTASGNAGSDILPAALTLNRPTSIVFDSANNLIIADRLNHKVRYYNRGATAVSIGAITINPGKIVTIACLNGSTGSNTENILAQSAACNRPNGLAVNDNYICFSNQGSHNVRCITLTGASAGRINTVAGYPQASARAGSPYGFEQEGISATSATLYYPSAIGFDSNGDLYIADTYNHIVRKVKLSP